MLTPGGRRGVREGVARLGEAVLDPDAESPRVRPEAKGRGRRVRKEESEKVEASLTRGRVLLLLPLRLSDKDVP